MAQQAMKAAEDNGMNGIWGFEFDRINSFPMNCFRLLNLWAVKQ
ncbi:MAG: hypothetical protein ACLU77_13340 [Waltera sp.]